MRRIAIYARYSSDLQREASIDDQVRACMKRIDGEGWQLVGTYTDHGMSGASSLRPGYQKLIEDARAGAFDVVIAESLDRLSRDQEDIAALYKQLSFAGIELITLSEGAVKELHVGLKGAMNALYLKDLAQKTHRGLEGRVRQGRSGGGLSYGYEVVRQATGTGEPETGLRIINEAEAAIVRRIFEDFAGGKSPRAIARALNDEAIPGPGGRAWQDTTIRGHVKRGTGLLNNELYVGRLVWNRQRFMKDPASGKRVARANQQAAWIQHDVPDLRIIDDELWLTVKTRQQEIAQTAATTGNRLNGAHRRRFLLSGLLTCGLCGGAYTIRGKDRYACANHANRATCTNSRTVKRQHIEARVLSGLKDHLLGPDVIESFIAEYLAGRNRQNRDKATAWAQNRRELADVEQRIAALLDALERGIITDTTKARLLELEARQRELAALTPPQAEPDLHPRLAHVYRQKIANLTDALDNPAIARQAGEALRLLIDRIVLYPGEARGQVHAELHGELGAILRLADSATKNRTALSDVRFSVVAGAGFEPATFRL